MIFDVTVNRYPARVGQQSLVGINSSSPLPWDFGNYCWIEGGPYLANMWAENLSGWARQNPGQEIEVTVLTADDKSIGVVTDPSADGWVNFRLCVTGHGWPSDEVRAEVERITGLRYDH